MGCLSGARMVAQGADGAARSRAADGDLHRPRVTCGERIAGLVGDMNTEVVAESPSRSVECVGIDPPADRVRSRGDEGAPAAAKLDLHLDELAGSRDPATAEAPGEPGCLAVEQLVGARVQ